MTRKSNSIWHPQWLYPCSEIIPGCLPTLNHQCRQMRYPNMSDKLSSDTCMHTSRKFWMPQTRIWQCIISEEWCPRRSQVYPNVSPLGRAIRVPSSFSYFSSASLEWQAHFAASLGAATEKISLACWKNWSNYNGLCRKTSKTKQSRNKGMGVSIPD